MFNYLNSNVNISMHHWTAPDDIQSLFRYNIANRKMTTLCQDKFGHVGWSHLRSHIVTKQVSPQRNYYFEQLSRRCLFL